MCKITKISVRNKTILVIKKVDCTVLRFYKGIKKTAFSMTLLSLLLLTACSSAIQKENAASEPFVREEALTGKETVKSLEASDGETNEAIEILIAAAASLKPVMEEAIIPDFIKSHPDFTISGTYDSSGKLQKQIEEGLDADLFLSAATKQIDALKEESLVDPASVTMLLENQIVLIVPQDSNSVNDFSEFSDIERAAVIAIGDPDSVPAGQYAKEALEQMGLWDSLQDRLSLGTNVTEVLNWIAEGSADAGIVYATDAATTDRVQVIASAPEGSLSERILYPAAILSDTEKLEAAELFLEYLTGSEAKEAFISYGFFPLTE